MRRLPSWQRSGVVSQQRLRFRRFDSLVKRAPKFRSEHVSFLFLVCFYIEYFEFPPIETHAAVKPTPPPKEQIEQQNEEEEVQSKIE